LMLSVPSFAQLGVGAKYVGMGSTGIAAATGLPSAYYNPAGIVKGPTAGFDLSLGCMTSDLDKITALMSDPNKFLTDNVANNVDMNLRLNTLIGMTVGKIGISAVALGSGNFTKAANDKPDSNVTAIEDIMLTFGTTVAELPIPMFTTGLDVGMNLKYIIGQRNIQTFGAILGTSSNGTISTGTGNGFGIDVGAAANVSDIVRVGAVIKDIGSTINWSNSDQAATYTVTGPTAGNLALGAKTTSTSSEARSMSYGIGVAAKLPGIGTQVAADLDIQSNNTYTHFGIEHPLIPMVMVVRLGYVTGADASIFTTGLGFAADTIKLAYTSDSKNNVTTAAIDIGFGF
ncbi:MAG: hypothetical protein V1843_04565, partial [bacterium]